MCVCVWCFKCNEKNSKETAKTILGGGGEEEEKVA